MSPIYRYRSLLLVLAVVGLLVPAVVQAQGRGGGGRGGGASSPGGGGGGGARAGGAPGGPANGGPGGPGGPVNGGRGGPGPGGPGYGYGGGYYPGYGARTAVVVGGYHYAPYWSFGFGWGYPYYPYYGYYGYPYAPYFGYPYPYYGYGYGTYDNSAALRLEVTPRETQVFIDGYIAGTVNDFDGMFQRLRLPPGGHKITLYLEGYRTVTQSLFLAAASDQKISYKLEPLQPGETSEPPPVAEPSADAPSGEYGLDATGAPPAPQEPARPAVPREPAVPRQPNATFGTLSIRVIPNDAEILVDGERWAAPAGQDRIAIQLSDGRHHLEVRKDGFALYQEDVLIRRGSTLTLNVSLLRGTEEGR